VDGHLGFSDGVHGRGYEWYIEFDVFGDVGGDIDISQAKVDVSWHHNEVIIRVSYTFPVVAKDFCSIESDWFGCLFVVVVVCWLWLVMIVSIKQGLVFRFY